MSIFWFVGYALLLYCGLMILRLVMRRGGKA